MLGALLYGLVKHPLESIITARSIHSPAMRGHQEALLPLTMWLYGTIVRPNDASTVL